MERSTFRLVVHVLLYDERHRVLLMRRANTGFLDGYYTFPGGHVDRGETVLEAARRECREEVGIEAETLEPAIVMPFSAGVDFIFEAYRWRGEARIGEPDKCDDLRFVELDHLPAATAPFVVKALELRSSGVWYHQFN